MCMYNDSDLFLETAMNGNGVSDCCAWGMARYVRI